MPRYLDDDVFQLAGAEDLVPTAAVRSDGGFEVRRYRPRTEGGFSRIEYWRSATGDAHWRVTTRENVTSIFGRDPAARIADPADTRRVFRWLLEETYDDLGNIVRFEYKPEDLAGVGNPPYELRRTPANRYLKRIRYGNSVDGGFHFEVALDYGEHPGTAPGPDETAEWPVRRDVSSSYRSGFDIRTYRLCRRGADVPPFEGPMLGNESVELYRQADDMPQVAWAYTNLASRYRSAQRPTDAANAQRSARDIYRTVSQSDPAYRRLLAQTSVVLASLLIHVALYDEAVASGQDGVDLYRQVDDQPQLARALAHHRGVLRIAGRHAESLAAGQEARDIYYRLAQTEPGFRPLLAQAAHDLAYVLDTAGRRQDAIASAREAVTLYEPLAQADPGRYAAFLAASRDLLSRLQGAG